MAVRPHRHAPRWRASPCACRADARRHSITRLHVAWFPRDRVRACRWSSPATDGFRRLSPSSPPRLNKAARRPAALLFVPHRDPLRLLPSRAAPDASGFALAGGGDRCRAGLRPYMTRKTRRHTHARGFPARSTPSDSHRHPKPCAAPPCSSLKLLRRGVTSHGAGPATGRASPCAFGRRQWVGEAIARAASDRPTARHAGGSRWERQPESETDSPRSNARYERQPSAATLARIARV